MPELNNQINPNAAIFTKEQLDKILKELDIDKAIAKNTPKDKTDSKKHYYQPEKSIGDILRENFKED